MGGILAFQIEYRHKVGTAEPHQVDAVLVSYIHFHSRHGLPSKTIYLHKPDLTKEKGNIGKSLVFRFLFNFMYLLCTLVNIDATQQMTNSLRASRLFFSYATLYLCRDQGSSFPFEIGLSPFFFPFFFVWFSSYRQSWWVFIFGCNLPIKPQLFSFVKSTFSAHLSNVVVGGGEGAGE